LVTLKNIKFKQNKKEICRKEYYHHSEEIFAHFAVVNFIDYFNELQGFQIIFDILLTKSQSLLPDGKPFYLEFVFVQHFFDLLENVNFYVDLKNIFSEQMNLLNLNIKYRIKNIQLVELKPIQNNIKIFVKFIKNTLGVEDKSINSILAMLELLIFNYESLEKDKEDILSQNMQLKSKIEHLEKDRLEFLYQNSQLKSKIENLIDDKKKTSCMLVEVNLELENLQKAIFKQSLDLEKINLIFESLLNEREQNSTQYNKFKSFIEQLEKDKELYNAKNGNTIIDLNKISDLLKQFKIIKYKELNEPYQLKEEDFTGTDKGSLKNVVCSICWDIVKYQIIQCDNCENLFCESCLAIHRLNKNNCPNCRQSPFKERIIGRLLKNILNEYKFKCPLECGIKIGIFDTENHKLSCEKARDVFKCNLCLMQLEYKISMKEEHALICKKLIISCNYCKKIVNKFDYKGHLEICQEYLIECKRCKFIFTREFEKAHSQYICQRFEILSDFNNSFKNNSSNDNFIKIINNPN